MRGKELWVGLVLAGVAACVSPATEGADSLPDLASADHPPDELGPFAVGHLSSEAVDDARGGRVLPLELWYPVDPGRERGHPRTQYPLLGPALALDSQLAWDGPPVAEGGGLALIVFSHGYRSVNIQSTGLMEALASHGFVVVAPEHVGNSQGAPDDDFDAAAGKRVPDVTFVVDHMLRRSEVAADPFHGRLGGAVGVVGHSFGGMTALGANVGWAGAPPDLRVRAIVPISAVIDGELQQDERSGPNAGFSAERLATADVPVLLVGGTADVDVPVQNNAIAFEQLVSAPAVYRLDVLGATHTHFANVCAIGDLLIAKGIAESSWSALGAGELSGPYRETCTGDAAPIEAVQRAVNMFAVAFLRYHLRGEREYAAYLTQSFAASEPMVELWVR